MEISFDFKRQAIGQNFVGREVEQNALVNLILGGQNVAIYGQDGIGKGSLINKAFVNLRKSVFDVVVCKVDLLSVRSEADFFRVYVNSLEKVFGPLNIEDTRSIIDITQKLKSSQKGRVVIYFEEFQNLLHLDDSDTLLENFESVVDGETITYLFSGSLVNAMKYIFEKKKFFYGKVEVLPIMPLNEKQVIEYVNRTFLRVGRVIDKSYINTFYKVSEGIPFYLNFLSFFAFNCTKGFVTADIVEDSIAALISLYEDKFKYIMSTLSNYQVSLLRAIVCGVTKFANKEVIDQYDLSSSANVFRLKEALIKKEIITYDDEQEPIIINPIFKYWLKKYYFV